MRARHHVRKGALHSHATRDAHTSHSVGVYSDHDGQPQAAAMIGQRRAASERKSESDHNGSRRATMKSTRDGSTQRRSQADQVAPNARLWADGGFSLRRCAECGHIGCCDSSPSQHASKHYAATGHPIITSFEPGEHWFYDYRTSKFFCRPKTCGPSLASVGSTGTGTGWSGAFELADAASRIGRACRHLGFKERDVTITPGVTR